MGDPKKLKKKYSTPAHPWNKTEIEENKILRREYGLNIQKELLIANSFLKKYKNIAKRLIADTSEQGQKEKKQMVDKLFKLGLLTSDAAMDSILSLTVRDILNRRLQSVIFRKGLARSMKQARQFITHRHVMVAEKEITAPSYLVSSEEEAQLNFKNKSSLSNEDHPERAIPEAKEIKAEAEAIKPKTEEKAEEAAPVEEKAEEVKEVTESKDSESSAKPAEPKTEEKVEETPKEEVKEEEASKEEVTEK
ncbi:30S ribosomal protein S4 [Candidatus Woesearchaeota archaeon]|jgi:small subunit ribosomal protein S4|nr:30S ribosomal protein S4 [Candidatus Woesearchaeota archaeon]MBT4110833.1 30S ribosomal protein S4 [Candidatus Woesearchaeota archaeon]MBT4336655.1 30S ribosomal protein S4 [Candidatus Woesearchaeota archaeon]MBT4469596.1 30S ribosomal protein S4 [Candidatus Woesearchaeota archaeon]MBT6743958.1 30S ribosomal protein S4 [Candidatus Woesearchaeota archaeon]